MTYYLHQNHPRSHEWGDGLSASFDQTTCGDKYECHPVVVIDPENPAAVKRLVRLYCENRDDSGRGALVRSLAMRAALRSLIATEKPPEPTGLGAVVEDSEGVTWVRVDPAGSTPWMFTGGGLFGVNGWRSYRDIAAVKVLSEGVTP